MQIFLLFSPHSISMPPFGASVIRGQTARAAGYKWLNKKKCYCERSGDLGGHDTGALQSIHFPVVLAFNNSRGSLVQ
jgi:hypothetical protein